MKKMKKQKLLRVIIISCLIISGLNVSAQQKGSSTDSRDGKTCKTKEIGNQVFTDSRDGKTYKTKEIGNQVWFAENLNYSIGNSWCYDDNSSNCIKYGRLYNWNTAIRVCPSGWHLPSKSEFETLLNNVGGEGTDAAYNSLIEGGNSGFSALLGGWRDEDKRFDAIGYGGYLWSSSEYNNTFSAWALVFVAQDALIGGNSKRTGYYVRCLQD